MRKGGIILFYLFFARKKERKKKFFLKKMTEWFGIGGKGGRKKEKELEKIGQGAYGCVLRPAIPCANEPDEEEGKEGGVDPKEGSASSEGVRQGLRGQVAKLMTTENAKKEIRAHRLAAKVDPDAEFTMPLPKVCRPKPSVRTMMSVKTKCRMGAKLIANNMAHTWMLRMPYGGLNLNALGEKLEVDRIPDRSQRRVVRRIQFPNFFEQIQVLMDGLHRMYVASYIHHDVKPHNLLFDLEDNRLRLIDFGLLKTVAEVKRRRRGDPDKHARFHFSYPLEMYFLSKQWFLRIALMNEPKIRTIEGAIHSLPGDLQREFSGAKEAFFNFSYTKNKVDLARWEEDFYRGYIFLLDSAERSAKKAPPEARKSPVLLWKYIEADYERMLQWFVERFDVYGLGFSLHYFFRRIRWYLSKSILKELDGLFYSMYHPNLGERISMPEALQRFTDISLKYQTGNMKILSRNWMEVLQNYDYENNHQRNENVFGELEKEAEAEMAFHKNARVDKPSDESKNRDDEDDESESLSEDDGLSSSTRRKRKEYVRAQLENGRTEFPHKSKEAGPQSQPMASRSFSIQKRVYNSPPAEDIARLIDKYGPHRTTHSRKKTHKKHHQSRKHSSTKRKSVRGRRYSYPSRASRSRRYSTASHRRNPKQVIYVYRNPPAANKKK